MCCRCHLRIADSSFCSLLGVNCCGWMNTVQPISGFYVCASGSPFESLSLLQSHEDAPSLPADALLFAFHVGALSPVGSYFMNGVKYVSS